ncbi:hypothetical protein LTR64_005079 [Lithohypha guttulata]|uniref:uncharacterized protein n=1 Tax=Lithohypha guttulata TaxID=1690604 RepID=UPI002DE06FD6|nr:hypothetical protein LTR51_005086 [Lithohypha guttulata]
MQHLETNNVFQICGIDSLAPLTYLPILVLGHSILKSLYQSQAHVGVNAFLGKDFFILASSTLTDLVLAHDCPNSNTYDLAETYRNRNIEKSEEASRWFYCGGLASTLFFTPIISFCHIHKKIPNPRLTKNIRLIIRLCVVVILACIPLAHHLTSLSLIGITTSLFLLVLILDIFGNSCPGDQFFTGGWGSSPDTRCKYTARLEMRKQRRAELQKKLTAGEKIKLEDTLHRSRSGSMGSETTMDVDEEWHDGHW